MKSVTLTDNQSGKTVEFPLLESVLGSHVIDISSLNKELGYFTYAAISAGINALWGRAHGGANESVVDQLEMIGDVSRVDAFITRAKDPNDDFRLMGFGHRVYKNFDPRARVLKKMRDKLQAELGISSKIIEIANRIEEIALNDEYFVSRNLYPSIDFYSGTLLLALQIPRSMFTPVFVIGRTVGWITQWMEQKQDLKGKADEVDAYPQIKNCLDKTLPKDVRDRKVKMRFFKELFTTVARKGIDGKTYKGKLNLNETHEEVLIIPNETLPSQKNLAIKCHKYAY